MSFTSFWVKKSFSYKKRFLSCFIIMLFSFALVVTALIFTKSMILGIQDRLIYLSSGHITVLGKSCPDIPDTQIQKTVSGYAMMYTSEDTASVMIKGVDSSYLQTRGKYLKTSQFNGLNRKNIIISKNLSAKLNLKPGDSVALMIIGDSNVPSARPEVCFVCALYDSGYSEIDDNIVFASFDYTLSLYPESDSISNEIIINDYSNVKLANIKRQLSDYHCRDWISSNYFLLENLSMSNQAIFFILLLLIVFSSFFTLYTTQQIVNDFRKKIAVCKMMGCNDSVMNRSIIISVMVYVLSALIIGLLLGILLGSNITSIVSVFDNGSQALKNYLLDFDVFIPWLSIVCVMLIQILLSYSFIFISACKSKKIKPIVLFR